MQRMSEAERLRAIRQMGSRDIDPALGPDPTAGPLSPGDAGTSPYTSMGVRQTPFIRRGPTRSGGMDPNDMTPAFGPGYQPGSPAPQPSPVIDSSRDDLTAGNGTKAPSDPLGSYLKLRSKGMGLQGNSGSDTIPMPPERPKEAVQNPYGGHTYTDAQGYSYNIPQGNDGAPMQMIGGPAPSFGRAFYGANVGKGVQSFMGNVGSALGMQPAAGQPMDLTAMQKPALGGLAEAGSPIAKFLSFFR